MSESCATSRSTPIRTSGSGLDQFTILFEMNSELGTITNTLSAERTVVDLMFSSRTSPSISPTTTQSPTFIGRSSISIKPDTKFEVTFCKPNPIPTLRKPTAIASPLRLSPAICSVTSSPVKRVMY